MKKFNKVWSFLCVLGIIISISGTTFAIEVEEEYDNNVEIMIQEAALRAKQNISNDDLKDAERIVNAVDEVFASLPSVYSYDITDSYNSMYYTTALSTQDGANSIQCADMIVIGLRQKKEAASLAATVDEDAYRHFSWNFYGTRNGTSESTRIFTCNYEWVTYMLKEINAYYEEKLIEYAHTPNSEYLAKTAAVAFAKNYRSELIPQLRNYLPGFERTFKHAGIQDFWNNNSGRVYAAKGYGSCMDAYKGAFNDGKLIWGDAPSSSQISITFNTQTMWIP